MKPHVHAAPLYWATLDLHHAVERTALGRAMADGTVSAQAWADWLEALWPIQQAVDEWLPPVLQRAQELLDDLHALPPGRPCEAAVDHAAALWSEHRAHGAAYVLTGAHLMGGRVIAARIGDRLPTAHLRWERRKEALVAFAPLRAREHVAAEARATFATLLAVAREIEGRGSVTA